MLWILLLTLGGTSSSHQLTAFSYDDATRVLKYTEAGQQKTVSGIGPVSLTSQQLVIKTNQIFASKFD